MRAPTDLPRRRARPFRGRIWLIVAAVILFFGIISLRGIFGFYTDFLWFQEVGFSRVWRDVLAAKAALAVIFTGLFFVVMWANLAIADRIAPRFRPAGPEEELVERYHDIVGSHTRLVRTIIALLFALIAGAGTSSQWNSWILFTHRVNFGTKDPVFHKDIGFYVFQLPFLNFVVSWAFASMVIVLIVTAVAHYLNGGIRVQVPAAQRVTPQVKAHLSVLLGVLALLKAAGYWLQRYQLNFSTRGFVDGAGYTAVHVQLPALVLLTVISFLAFGLFLYNIRLRGWALPIIAVALWAFTSVIVGGAVPAIVQKFSVQPNQSKKEAPYIRRNIDSTRVALGLDKVEVRSFDYNESLTQADLTENTETIRNVRLWDPLFLKDTYKQLQEIRQFYTFNDVDIDRYLVNGKPTQVVLSARELDSSGVPSKSWENLHLNFTHGYGAVLSPANAVTSDGLPDFLEKDLPPVGQPALKEPQASLYYGEGLSGYAIVKTKRPETLYQKADGTTIQTSYQGEGGVRMSSLLRRIALAFRFGDINPLISGFVTSQSRAMYIRDIRDRVRKAAPFLHYDSDPYPVVLEGRIFWVQDAYTTSSHYPYGQRAPTDRLPGDSGLRSSFNYVRNSVKVLTDSYNGTMTFYVIDQKDPIVRAYEKAFPQLFTPGSSMPGDLRAHLRYPEDLFRVQTNAFGSYHIRTASEFYGKTDAWDIARNPGSGQVTAAETTTPAGPGLAVPAVQRMDPYYLLMRLPNEQTESFLILQPFTPANKDLLSAFMIAKSDPADYGKLEAFVMPRTKSVNGPTQVDARIQQEPSISKLITLLNTSGSKVEQGNLLVIPIKQSLLYIRPLYVVAENTQLPELKKVIVVYANKAVMEDTLRQALADIFGQAPPTLEQAPGAPTTITPTAPSAPTVAPDVQQLLDQALADYAKADADLRNGDLAAYQRDIADARAKTNQARQRSSPQSSTTTTTRPASA
ncbi:MAG: UPF0182 family protein [Actinobacteria bacterium]|nr:MAG: UPF0182 family protein [Actinomycetota bacterium]